jgi:transcriptional regulator with XRE-family HTH domain
LASHTLGTRLKVERESRGFTLVQISDSTKIPLTLLEALERDDLSRWPKGLYRRAFFRSYVTALGLRTEPLVVEFSRLFPDDTSSSSVPASELAAGGPEGEVEQPLALAWAGPSTAHRMLRSGAMALAEVGILAAIGAVIAWTSGVHLFEAIGAVALVYLPGARMAAERSRRWHLDRRTASVAQREPLPLTLRSAGAGDAGGPVSNVRIALAERCAPVTARITEVISVASPAARRTGQLLKVGGVATGRVSLHGSRVVSSVLIRSAMAAGARLGAGGRYAGRACARAFAAGSYVFWKGVRSAAEYAELLATRQLNRTND